MRTRIHRAATLRVRTGPPGVSIGHPPHYPSRMAGIIVLCILTTVLAALVTVVWWALGNAWEKKDRERRDRYRPR